jgi:hypothetical protein
LHTHVHLDHCHRFEGADESVVLVNLGLQLFLQLGFQGINVTSRSERRLRDRLEEFGGGD